MSLRPDNAQQKVTLLKRDSILPPTLEQALRGMALDRFTGNVQLNLRDGKILGFHKNQIVMIPSHEIQT